MKWEKLPNGKWKRIKTGIKGKVDPYDPRYGIKLKAQMKKINPYISFFSTITMKLKCTTCATINCKHHCRCACHEEEWTR